MTGVLPAGAVFPEMGVPIVIVPPGEDTGRVAGAFLEAVGVGDEGAAGSARVRAMATFE